MAFNPLDYQLSMMRPRLVTDASAWCAHIPFAFSLVEMLRPGAIVELGTHKGDSYCAFCQAVDVLKLDARCTAIDTWEGDVHAGTYGKEVLAELRATHDPQYGRFSTLMQATFDDAASRFDPKSIDLLHIDGLHTYSAVRHDYETWLPKMSDSGVILFHDVTTREYGFGVWQLWEEIIPTRPSFLFEHAGGLGIVAVGDATPAPFQKFIADALADPRLVRAYFARLGSSIEFRRRLMKMTMLLLRQKTLIDEWKRRTGQEADIWGLQSRFSFEDVLSLMNRLNNDIKEALKSDLHVREQLKQTKTNG